MLTSAILAETPSFPLSIRPDPLSLGTLRPGVSAKGMLTLRNSGAEPITVERIDTSCPCVTLSPIPLVVPSNASATLTVAYDANDDPRFRGGLEVDVIGRSEAGKELFKTVIRLSVLDETGGDHGQT